VLGGDDGSEFVGALLEDAQEAIEDARGPGREGGLDDCDRSIDLGGRRERNRRRLLTGRRIEAG